MTVGQLLAQDEVTHHWLGHNDAPGLSNDLSTDSDGPYTFALQATSVANPSLTSVYRGVINVRGEGP